MKYVNLTNTDLVVSTLCLGTSKFGRKFSKELAFEEMDHFTKMGGNFFDTARVYGEENDGLGGVSEKTIGEWMKINNMRDQIIISTKGGHPPMGQWDVVRATPECLEVDLKESLENLQTDYIDLYLMHRDNPNIPVSEFIEWMEQKVKEGKIRYYGCSNWSLERIKEANAYAKSKGYRGFVVSQIMSSLAAINKDNLVRAGMHILDEEDAKYYVENGMSMMAYMSLGSGYLMKKVRGEYIKPLSVRAYINEANERVCDTLVELTSLYEYSMEDYNIHYFDSMPMPTVSIGAFSSCDQMDITLTSIDKDIPIEYIQKLIQSKGSI